MSIKRAAALVLLAACMAWLGLSINRAPDVYEYNLLAPRVEEKQEEQLQNAQQPAGEKDTPEEAAARKPKLTALEELLKSFTQKMEDLPGAVSAYGLRALTPGTSFKDGAQGSAPALLQGLWGDLSLYPKDVLAEGRHLYYEEIQTGIPVAVISQQLAISLFRVGDPIGRRLYIGETAFRVVGITRHARTAGEMDTAYVQVPLKALDKAGIQSQMLSFALVPKPGAGAYAALSQGLTQWQPGGTFYSLPKEQYRAMLPVRLLICLAGLLLLHTTLHLAGSFTLAMWRGGKRQLESAYAPRLLPGLIGRGALVALVYALNLTAAYFLLQGLIAPVMIFPEWVPNVLVEPKDIISTFWNLRAQESVLVSLRTPDILRLRFLHRLMTAAALCTGFLLVRPLWTLHQKAREIRESLR
ncbi:MAG: ABC transporter permease [Clostridiales bacterium]|nr:ABC transporter permease [Clostridiales bacterium]